ncbi:MAG: PAS domain S-box protein [Actinobacteria bacterium]|nr:MAG: PAS domain S-box protein [Actinomycetota bacterium]
MNEPFEALLEFLKRARGFDFTGYKRASLERRVGKRLSELGIDGYPDYIDFLEVHPDEFAHLFNTILINVTGFFRDREAWDQLATVVIPRIVKAKRSHQPIRVWCAGCASGEEAYSVAILLGEALGQDAFRERVKIFATDIDEDALAQARQASYGPDAVAEIAADQRERYFEQAVTRFLFRNDLRRSVIFGRHDLIQDAPISRLDLLVCRNVLMYFNADAQARILSNLHFAMNDSGYLFLGKAEMLLTHTDLFSPLELKHRLFTKVVPAKDRESLIEAARVAATLPGIAAEGRVSDLAFDTGLVAQIVVDSGGRLASANRAAVSTFALKDADMGRPLQDLELSYRPIDLRSLIDEAHAEQRPVSRAGVEYPRARGGAQFRDVVVVPLVEQGSVIGASISFSDVTMAKRLQEDLQRSKEELETAYEELQSTNEELETTNEELQSTVEELETTNEELQSTNEELETMNEELQSTNTELQAINDELNDRSAALDRATAWFESILASQRSAVVVVDRALIVQEWNPRAEDLWGLRPREVKGRAFLDLDIGLPVAELAGAMRASLVEESAPAPTTVRATNRRGRSIECQVMCNPLVGADGRREGVVVVMDVVEALPAAGG